MSPNANRPSPLMGSVVHQLPFSSSAITLSPISPMSTAAYTQEVRNLEQPFDLGVIPDNLEAEDGLSQSVVLEAVLLAQKGDGEEDARFFEQPVVSASLKYLKGIYESKNTAAALKLLARRVRVDYNRPETVTATNSPNISWTVERHFIDMLVCVGNRIGLGAVLPNQTVNSFYAIKFDFSRKGKEFKAKNVKLGFDPSGSMLWVGNMPPSGDDIWIAWIPQEEEEGVEGKGLSTCLSERHYRMAVMFFAYVLRKILFRDITVHDQYPDIASAQAFHAATNIL